MDFLTSKRFVTTALVLLTLLNVTLLSILWLQNTQQHLPGFLSIGHKFNRRPSFIESLSLNESQRIRFRNLRSEHFRKVSPEMENIALLKKQLVEESLKDKPDTKKIEVLASDIGYQQTIIERELALHFHELAKVCTSEQRDSLKKVLDRIATHNHFMRMNRSIELRP